MKLIYLIFQTFSLFSSFMVVNLSNSIYSVLFLILSFVNLSGILFLFGVDFLTFIFLIVYIGAIAILFLFVIMMLNVKLEHNKIIFKIGGPIISLILGVLIYQFIIYQNIYIELDLFNENYLIWLIQYYYLNNIEILGLILYTNYIFLFLVSSLILLIAMIGSIVMTIYQKKNIFKQEILFQTNKQLVDSIKFIKIR
uniref:NADH-ubiquinone oxidoreductase chain 6 n=1 Tax=Pterocladiophila hemisphaerica TaxID=2712948 RepID=A0A6M3WWQ0_9FLOR|nr:Nad6 [Pterocladiophila hemisphaerica]